MDFDFSFNKDTVEQWLDLDLYLQEAFPTVISAVNAGLIGKRTPLFNPVYMYIDTGLPRFTRFKVLFNKSDWYDKLTSKIAKARALVAVEVTYQGTPINRLPFQTLIGLVERRVRFSTQELTENRQQLVMKHADFDVVVPETPLTPPELAQALYDSLEKFMTMHPEAETQMLGVMQHMTDPAAVSAMVAAWLKNGQVMTEESVDMLAKIVQTTGSPAVTPVVNAVVEATQEAAVMTTANLSGTPVLGTVIKTFNRFFNLSKVVQVIEKVLGFSPATAIEGRHPSSSSSSHHHHDEKKKKMKKGRSVSRMRAHKGKKWRFDKEKHKGLSIGEAYATNVQNIAASLTANIGVRVGYYKSADSDIWSVVRRNNKLEPGTRLSFELDAMLSRNFENVSRAINVVSNMGTHALIAVFGVQPRGATDYTRCFFFTYAERQPYINYIVQKVFQVPNIRNYLNFRVIVWYERKELKLLGTPRVFLGPFIGKKGIVPPHDYSFDIKVRANAADPEELDVAPHINIINNAVFSFNVFPLSKIHTVSSEALTKRMKDVEADIDRNLAEEKVMPITPKAVPVESKVSFAPPRPVQAEKIGQLVWDDKPWSLADAIEVIDQVCKDNPGAFNANDRLKLVAHLAPLRNPKSKFYRPFHTGPHRDHMGRVRWAHEFVARGLKMYSSHIFGHDKDGFHIYHHSDRREIYMIVKLWLMNPDLLAFAIKSVFPDFVPDSFDRLPALSDITGDTLPIDNIKSDDPSVAIVDAAMKPMKALEDAAVKGSEVLAETVYAVTHPVATVKEVVPIPEITPKVVDKAADAVAEASETIFERAYDTIKEVTEAIVPQMAFQRRAPKPKPTPEEIEAQEDAEIERLRQYYKDRRPTQINYWQLPAKPTRVDLARKQFIDEVYAREAASASTSQPDVGDLPTVSVSTKIEARSRPRVTKKKFELPSSVVREELEAVRGAEEADAILAPPKPTRSKTYRPNRMNEEEREAFIKVHGQKTFDSFANPKPAMPKRSKTFRGLNRMTDEDIRKFREAHGEKAWQQFLKGKSERSMTLRPGNMSAEYYQRLKERHPELAALHEEAGGSVPTETDSNTAIETLESLERANLPHRLVWVKQDSMFEVYSPSNQGTAILKIYPQKLSEDHYQRFKALYPERAALYEREMGLELSDDEPVRPALVGERHHAVDAATQLDVLAIYHELKELAGEHHLADLHRFYQIVISYQDLVSLYQLFTHYKMLLDTKREDFKDIIFVPNSGQHLATDKARLFVIYRSFEKLINLIFEQVVRNVDVFLDAFRQATNNAVVPLIDMADVQEHLMRKGTEFATTLKQIHVEGRKGHVKVHQNIKPGMTIGDLFTQIGDKKLDNLTLKVDGQPQRTFYRANHAEKLESMTNNANQLYFIGGRSRTETLTIKLINADTKKVKKVANIARSIRYSDLKNMIAHALGKHLSRFRVAYDVGFMAPFDRTSIEGYIHQAKANTITLYYKEKNPIVPLPDRPGYSRAIKAWNEHLVVDEEFRKNMHKGTVFFFMPPKDSKLEANAALTLNQFAARYIRQIYPKDEGWVMYGNGIYVDEDPVRFNAQEGQLSILRKNATYNVEKIPLPSRFKSETYVLFK